MVIEIVKEMLSIHCLLPCSNCGTWTRHVLSRSGEFYSCPTKDCNEVVWVEFPDLLEDIEY